MYPSAHKPVPPKHIFHGQVSEKALLHLLAMLEKPDSLQRYAFGVKMIEILGGKENVTIKKIDCCKKIPVLAAQLLVAFDS